MSLNSVLLDNGERVVMMGHKEFNIGMGSAGRVAWEGVPITEDYPVVSHGNETTPKKLFAHPCNHNFK